MKIAPTPKDEIFSEGTARLYRFRRPSDDVSEVPATRYPLLVVPSLINRWYILDLLSGMSVVEACSQQLDTYLLDWGVPNDEDRYLTWNHVLKRLARAVRRVKRATGSPKVSILGYCMGGTLSSIYTALHPDQVSALVNLAGPIDFSKGGRLQNMTDPRWFDVDAIVATGNLAAPQMQSGFTMLRPLLSISKWVNYPDIAFDPAKKEHFEAMEQWASDNTPFPAAAYRTYIHDLYQNNALVNGSHRALGRAVDLAEITCPVLSIVASKDGICPAPAATALNDAVSSKRTDVLEIRGGHVGAVVGPRASTTLYPGLVDWLMTNTARAPVALV